MTFELHATPQEVMRAVEAVQAFARERQVGDKDLFGLSLALEECGSNIVNHAYQNDGRQKFQVTVQYTGSAVVLELRDRGPEFDPTRESTPRELGAEEDRRTGGWGIVLARHYMDEICYRRELGENVLRLTRNLERPPS
jgi:anti-sigma regulatory factor (Ser/Thr protein kinase)